MTKMAIKNDLAYQSVEQSDKDDDDVVDWRSKKPDAAGRSQSTVAILVNLKMRTK